jgi:hypothetical protein
VEQVQQLTLEPLLQLPLVMVEAGQAVRQPVDVLSRQRDQCVDQHEAPLPRSRSRGQ